MPFFALIPLSVSAQEIEKDTTGKGDSAFEFAESAIFDRDKGYKILQGEVIIRRDSTFMFCDSAIIRDSSITAIGNVSIVQSDTIAVFADSLVYHSDSMVARLYGTEQDRVVLENGKQKLFTNYLLYDVDKKIANYTSGAILQNDRTKLKSRRGVYFVNAKLAKFFGNVVVQDSSFNLWADSLHYQTDLDVVLFRGPTRLDVDSSRIYAERGFYDIPNEKAEFEINAQYEKGDALASARLIRYDGNSKDVTLIGKAVYTENDKEIRGDTIIHNRNTELSTLIGNASYKDSINSAQSDRIVYDGKNEAFITRGRSKVVDPPMIIEADFIDYNKNKGVGLVKGNVIWRDTSANTTIFCEEIVQDSITGVIKAYSFHNERPIFENILDKDTLFLSADTLVSSNSETEDSNKLFLAYRDVKIFKPVSGSSGTDFRAVCDSLSYVSEDSTFHLFRNAFMWADSTQFSGDTMDIMLKNKKIDKLKIRQNSFIIDTPDNQFYNQIKGKVVDIYFTDNELDYMEVTGNAESLYYILDSDNAYIGVSKTTCSRIKFIFEDKKLNDIRFYSKPESKLTPMEKANHNALRLTGFNWNIANKPQSLEAIKVRNNE